MRYSEGHAAAARAHQRALTNPYTRREDSGTLIDGWRVARSSAAPIVRRPLAERRGHIPVRHASSSATQQPVDWQIPLAGEELTGHAETLGAH